MSENSPLLGPTAGSGSGSGSGFGAAANSASVMEIPITRGFGKTTQRSSFVSGSVGRKGFADAFIGYQSGGSVFNEEGDGAGEAITSQEAAILAREEQELLQDNNINYNTTSPPSSNNLGAPLVRPVSAARQPSIPQIIGTAKAWDDAVEDGQVRTNPQLELAVLFKNSAPLIVTFSLQYSLTVASIFSVGHIGKTELGAVSLASMTASITGYAMIQGLATCLDTLCAQAYGAGNLHLVGVYFQRCVLMIFACFIPVGIFWLLSDKVMVYILPDKDVTDLAMQYLRIVTAGAPGYILFECGKRFTQAQGIFHASTYVLFVCAPINVILNYVLVWNKTIGIGYHGAAVAVAITDWLMAIMLFMYVAFIDGKQCWPGFSPKALTGWGRMVKLAIPGVIMVEAEFLAFEVLTLAASYFGTTALAAQSVLSTITSLAYQIPFAVSIATSTRVANFIGATLAKPAKIAATVSISFSLVIAVTNAVVLYVLRYDIGSLFSSDEEVLEVVAAVFPMCAFMQIFDATGAVGGGLLRGQGRQHIGGYLNLFFYYIVGLPLSFFLAFTLDLKLYGLWAGITVGLALISIGQAYAVFQVDWDKLVEIARTRGREERIVVSH